MPASPQKHVGPQLVMLTAAPATAPSCQCSHPAVTLLFLLAGLYTLGFNYGGPVVITWGWIISVVFTCAVAAR